MLKSSPGFVLRSRQPLGVLNPQRLLGVASVKNHMFVNPIKTLKRARPDCALTNLSYSDLEIGEATTANSKFM
jgi:hypothetical protein